MKRVFLTFLALTLFLLASERGNAQVAIRGPLVICYPPGESDIVDKCTAYCKMFNMGETTSAINPVCLEGYTSCTCIND